MTLNEDLDFLLFFIIHNPLNIENCVAFLDEIKHAFNNKNRHIDISYQCWDDEKDVFFEHIEGVNGFKHNECCVRSGGAIFNEKDYGSYLTLDTIDDVIYEWCYAMGVERKYKNQRAMVNYINNYKYDDDSYFQIRVFKDYKYSKKYMKNR